MSPSQVSPHCGIACAQVALAPQRASCLRDSKRCACRARLMPVHTTMLLSRMDLSMRPGTHLEDSMRYHTTLHHTALPTGQVTFWSGQKVMNGRRSSRPSRFPDVVFLAPSKHLPMKGSCFRRLEQCRALRALVQPRNTSWQRKHAGSTCAITQTHTQM